MTHQVKRKLQQYLMEVSILEGYFNAVCKLVFSEDEPEKKNLLEEAAVTCRQIQLEILYLYRNANTPEVKRLQENPKKSIEKIISVLTSLREANELTDKGEEQWKI